MPGKLFPTGGPVPEEDISVAYARYLREQAERRGDW